jgi:hypothetical protein
MRLIGWQDLKARGINFSRIQIDRLVKQGLFPPPVKLGYSTQGFIKAPRSPTPPDYIERITVIIDDDNDSRRHAETLMSRLHARRIEVRSVVLNLWATAAA